MLLTNEIKTLLQISAGKADAAITPDVIILRLIQLAFRHKTVYQLLVFAQHHPEYFTREQLEKLETRSRKIAMQSLTQLHELKKIADLFNTTGTGYVCIKGPQLSRMIYGREALKESVDLDIMLTNAVDLDIVHEMLFNLGYDKSNLNDYPGKWRRKIFLIAKREIHFFNKQNRCAIDLHIRPGANTYLTEGRFSGFLDDLTSFDLEGTPVPVLKDEAYLVYLCYHGALHQFARLAWLLDIRAFLKLKQEHLDFKKVLSIARDRKIERCVLLAFQLINDYFGENFSDLFSDSVDKRNTNLANICRSMLVKEAGYGMSLQGRVQ